MLAWLFKTFFIKFSSKLQTPPSPLLSWGKDNRDHPALKSTNYNFRLQDIYHLVRSIEDTLSFGWGAHQYVPHLQKWKIFLIQMYMWDLVLHKIIYKYGPIA